MDGLMNKLRNLDAYLKINEDFYSRTLSGGLITLASSIIMILLFLSKLLDFFTTSYAFSQLEVKSTNTTSTNNSVDPFATVPEIKSTNTTRTNNNIVDPFVAVPLNNFDDSDLFGSFTSHSEPSQNSNSSGSNDNNLGGNLLSDSNTLAKKDPFGVKSGIWADSLSRGLIDLNISAPKKVNLANVGIVGGLSDGTNEKEKGPPNSFYMGRAMGSGFGLGKSGSIVLLTHFVP